MEGWNIYGVVGTIIFIIIFIGVICWAIKDRNAIMKRARKIDPTVSTLSEAQYVLKKILHKVLVQEKKMIRNNNLQFVKQG